MREFGLSQAQQLILSSLDALATTASTEAIRKSGGSFVNSTITGSLSYQGAWNASTNTPTLSSGSGSLGVYYIVSVAGTTTLNGISTWQVGDMVLSNGTAWQRISNNNTLSGLADVTITTPASAQYLRYIGSNWANSSILAADLPTAIDAAKIGAGAVSNTEFGYLDGVTSAIQTQIDLKAPLASPTFTGTVTIPTPFTLGATSVTTTGTQLNYLNAATGKTGTGNIVFSSSPTIATPVFGTGTAGTGLQTDYAFVYCSTSTAYRGGLLISNAQDSLSTSCSWKINSTFNTARGSAVMSMGFVNNNATETFTTNSAGFMQFADNSGVGSAAINVPLSCNSTLNISGVINGVNYAFYGTNATGNTNVLNNDSLTTGSVLALWSNSGSTSTRDIASFSNTNASATGATVVNITNASTGNALAVTGKVAINGTTTYQGTSSTTLANITSVLRAGSVVLTAPYVADGFTNALYWSTTDDNPAIPKTCIWSKMTGAGSLLFIGTSNNYSSGITSVGFQMDQNGAVTLGTASITTLTVSSSLTSVASLVIGGQATATSVGLELGNLSGGTPFIDWKLGNVDYNMRTILSASDTLYFSSSTATGSVGFTTRIILDGNHSFISASSNAYLYHSTTLGLVLYGNGSTDDLTIAGATGANIMSVATGTTTARFYGAVNIGGTFTRRAQSGVTSQLQIEGTGFDSSSMSLFVNEASGATTAPCLFLSRSRGSAVGSNTIVQSGDRVGLILFEGTDGTIPQPLALIQANVDGTPGANDMPGRLEFYTSADGSISPALRMTISSTGLVTLATALTVPNGGTGLTTTTAYSVLCGGTTSTGALQSVSGVGTSGQVLTSNGAGALPTWQTGGGGGTTYASAVASRSSTDFIFYSDDTAISSKNAGTSSIYLTSGGMAKSNSGNSQSITYATIWASATECTSVIIVGGYVYAYLNNGTTSTRIYRCATTADISTAGNWTQLTISGAALQSDSSAGLAGYGNGNFWVIHTTNGFVPYALSGTTLTSSTAVTVTSATYDVTYSRVNGTGIYAYFASGSSRRFANFSGTLDGTKQMDVSTTTAFVNAGAYYLRQGTDNRFYWNATF